MQSIAMYEKITDKEAASLLGVRYETIRNAVKRGDLTRIPMAGLVQHVAKEQVELYKRYGSKRLTRNALSPEDRQRWQAIHEEIATPNRLTSQVELVPTGRTYREVQPVREGVPQGGPFLVPEPMLV